MSWLAFICFHNLQHHATRDIGLYRDDGLAVFKDTSGPQAEKIKKKFQKVFNDNGLKITILCNLKIVDFDATFNLKSRCAMFLKLHMSSKGL